MKRVKVATAAAPVDPVSVLTAERLYTVTLGNHRQVRFASERHALAFQAEASRFLSDVLNETNLLLSETFTAYRMAWPYMPKRNETAAMFIRDAERALDSAAAGANGPNAVYFQWKAIGEALASLRALALLLERFYRSKTMAVQRFQLGVLVRRCSELGEGLRVFGTDVATAKGYR